MFSKTTLWKIFLDKDEKKKQILKFKNVPDNKTTNDNNFKCKLQMTQPYK